MKYDLRINSKCKIDMMTRGFFEHINGLSLTPMPEMIEVENFRFCKSDCERHPKLFDEFLARQDLLEREVL